MAGVEERPSYKVAQVIEDKSWVVGSVALIASVFAPALLGVALIEGAEIVGARAWKNRLKKQETPMQPGKQYKLKVA